MAFQITLHQIIVFFLVLAIGFAAGKLGIIEKDYLPKFAKLITSVLLPVMIFTLTRNGSTREMVFENWGIIVFAVVFYVAITLIMYGIAKLLRLRPDRDRVFTLCFVFGNTGFIGTPLLAALYPDGGLMYMGLFGIVDIAYFWTGGLFWATARDREYKVSPKNFITPNLVAMVLAFAFILLELPIPGVINDTLVTVSNATSACCMIYLGALLCFSNWAAALKCKELYVGILVKMIALPIVGGKILFALGWPTDVATSMIVLMSLPVMTIVPMIASQRGHEGDYAAGIAVATLVVSVITIPLVQLLVTL